MNESDLKIENKKVQEYKVNLKKKRGQLLAQTTSEAVGSI